MALLTTDFVHCTAKMQVLKRWALRIWSKLIGSHCLKALGLKTLKQADWLAQKIPMLHDAADCLKSVVSRAITTDVL